MKAIIGLISIVGAGFLLSLALSPVEVPKPEQKHKVTHVQLPEMKVVGVIPTQISDLPKAEAGMIKRQTSKRQGASCEHNKTWAVGFEGDPEEPDNFRMVRLLCK